MDSKKRKEKLAKVEAITAAVNKKFGEDSVNYLGNNAVKAVPKFSSQCPELDIALGGGWPVGRIIELYGPPSGGKTTTTLHAISSFQAEFPDEYIRKDTYSDGDVDKEANFWVLAKTAMPAILSENFFMTNYDNCHKYLMTEEGRDRIAKIHFQMIQELEK